MIPSRLVFVEQLLPVSTVPRWSRGCAVGCVMALAATLGCATGTTTPRAPSLAFAAVASAPSACTIDGSPRVVATKAAPAAGVEAEGDWPQVWLRFAPQAHAQLALAVDPESLKVVEAHESSPSNFEAKKPIQPTFWSEGTSPAPVSTSSVVVVPVDSHRSVLAWTEGSIHTGLDVRVLTVGRDGEPLGAAVTLAHEGSAIGIPTIAFASSGRGLVAFLESSGRGFQVVAASLDCRAPAAMEASAFPATYIR